MQDKPLSFSGKPFKVTGHLFFLVLLILAVILYRERILYADSAWQLFKIIQFSQFNIEAGRYGTMITQILPLIAVRQEWPLSAVVMSYSVSFVLVYYAVYLVSVYLLRNDTAGLAIILILVLGIRHSFYHSVTETHQGLVYSVLFFAWLYYMPPLRNKAAGTFLHIFISLLIITLCYFIHPVTFFPVVFVIVYRILDKNDWKQYSLYGLVLFSLVLYSVKFLSTGESSYEGQIFASFSNAFSTLGDFFDLYSFKFFVKRLGGLYFFSAVMALAVAVYYIQKKSWLKLAWFVVSGSGFFVITVLTYHMGDSDMAMERSFMPLGIFICIPFVNDIIMRTRKHDLLEQFFVLAVLIISLAGIIRKGLIYRDRRAYVENLLYLTESFPGRKFIVEKQDTDMSRLVVPWAIGAETLLYSSLDSPSGSRTIYLVESFETFRFDRDNPDLYMCVDFWRNWDASRLNPAYFRLQPGRYIPIHIE